MTSPASDRPILSRDQLLKYISCIYECEPSSAQSQLDELKNLIQSDPLRGLTQLQQRHLAAIPFSNLVLHYSQHYSVSLDPDVLFHKLVERGLGGYCFENTEFLGTALRTLGFKFYTGAARVNKGFQQGVDNGDYHGWGHQIIIVTIGNDKYIVDVGFGPNGPTRPMLLRHGATSFGIAPAEARLVKECISANTDSEQKPWVYQIRSGPEDNWRGAYCFYEIEFLPSDYEKMNFSTYVNPKSIFTKSVICAKFLLNDAKDDIVGSLSIVKETVKRNFNGEVETFPVLKSEGERVDALKTLFNIQLLPAEARGIRGKITELRDVTTMAF